MSEQYRCEKWEKCGCLYCHHHLIHKMVVLGKENLCLEEGQCGCKCIPVPSLAPSLSQQQENDNTANAEIDAQMAAEVDQPSKRKVWETYESPAMWEAQLAAARALFEAMRQVASNEATTYRDDFDYLYSDFKRQLWPEGRASK
jgi:hypothetical protein